MWRIWLFWIALIHNISAAPFTPNPLDNFTLPQDTSTHVSGGEEYIVIVSRAAPHMRDVLKRLELSPEHVDVLHVFNNSAFRGFSARISPNYIEALGKMGDILHVEKTAMATSHDLPAGESTRAYTTWGLQRISSSTPPFGSPKTLSYTYTYSSGSTLGQGVDIYVVDTGINTANIVFGGRARMGFSFTHNIADEDGHGTHVSGTAAGAIVGVASNANLIGVKVLGANGAGSTSDTLAGMDYVINAHDQRKHSAGAGAPFKGSIMSMSWGLSAISSAIQTAISAALAHGIHVSMAAGNSGTDACAASPSAAGGSHSAAVSVGSVGPAGAISSFSNTGPCVDVYAPGEDVLSAWIGADNTLYYLSGTSMATPHVTGVMAYLLGGDEGGSLAEDPAALKRKLLGLALANVVGGNGNVVAGDRGLLLNNGITGSVSLGVRLYGRNAEPVFRHDPRASLAERQRIHHEERAFRWVWKGKMSLGGQGKTMLRY